MLCNADVPLGALASDTPSQACWGHPDRPTEPRPSQKCQLGKAAWHPLFRADPIFRQVSAPSLAHGSLHCLPQALTLAHAPLKTNSLETADEETEENMASVLRNLKSISSARGLLFVSLNR